MNGSFNEFDPDRIREEELEEAEHMIRSGMGRQQIMRKRFTFVEQSDIFKLFRKYGADPDEEEY